MASEKKSKAHTNYEGSFREADEEPCCPVALSLIVKP
jgi:hypothetical protein